ncbi:MAG: nucleoside 2-deoxyribosyltransferase [Desulfovibrio sp.]|jgi:nucleoside 2-deoxyribosyltransferase|nr:nucleoside 2-deoxyribosyltransferase [Desulfovibrio sp.]
MSHTVYQTGPVFSQSEKDFHGKIAAALRAAGDTVVWSGGLIPDSRFAAAGADVAPLVFTARKQAIDRCTCVVALLDGSQTDGDAAWDIGYAHARGLPIYGIRTDSRMAGATGRRRGDAMIAGCLAGFAENIKDLVKLIHDVPQADKVVDEAARRGW